MDPYPYLNPGMPNRGAGGGGGYHGGGYGFTGGGGSSTLTQHILPMLHTLKGIGQIQVTHHFGLVQLEHSIVQVTLMV